MKSFERIIVLDDDPFFGKLILHFLENQGYSNVEFFQNELQCINTIKIDEHCLILIDHQLNTTTGIIVMERISILTQNARFIMISGQEHYHIAIKSIKKGALDYIEKNKFTLLRLGQLLKDAIENSEENFLKRNAELELKEHREAHFSSIIRTNFESQAVNDQLSD
jgi:two-component system response regulator AtoC